MVMPGKRFYVCKYCGKKLEVNVVLTTSRLINHLYDFHPAELEELKDIPLNNVIDQAYNLVEGKA